MKTTLSETHDRVTLIVRDPAGPVRLTWSRYRESLSDRGPDTPARNRALKLLLDAMNRDRMSRFACPTLGDLARKLQSLADAAETVEAFAAART